MESIQNLNLIGPLVSEIWIFKLISICKFQNDPCALGFEVKHSIFFVQVSVIYINIYINKNVNVRLYLTCNLRKYCTDRFEILTQRYIRIREC